MLSLLFCSQLRDYIINQTTGDREMSVKYHYDNIVMNYLLINYHYLFVTQDSKTLLKYHVIDFS